MGILCIILLFVVSWIGLRDHGFPSFFLNICRIRSVYDYKNCNCVCFFYSYSMVAFIQVCHYITFMCAWHSLRQFKTREITTKLVTSWENVLLSKRKDFLLTESVIRTSLPFVKWLRENCFGEPGRIYWYLKSIDTYNSIIVGVLVTDSINFRNTKRVEKKSLSFWT